MLGAYFGDSTQLTYLRSRFYASGTGRFLTRDTWMGDYSRPLSLNHWNYVEANPINLIDPTGQFPVWCKSMSTRLGYEDCVRGFYHLSAPKAYPTYPQQEIKDTYGISGCWGGPVAYMAPGYLEGYSVTFAFAFGYSFGEELVFDFGTMEKGKFKYETYSVTLDAGGSAMVYHGLIHGFNNVDGIEEKYRGAFSFVSAGISTKFPFPTPNIGAGLNYFSSFDRELFGVSQYYSVGVSLGTLTPGGSFAGGIGSSTPIWSRSYRDQSGSVNSSLMYDNIAFDRDSPIWLASAVPPPSALVKAPAMVLYLHWARIYDEIHLNSK